VEWLKDNAFLAAWLALPIAVFAIYVQNRGKQFKDYDWNWITIYLTFGRTIGITFTKTFDTFSRKFAKWLAMLSFFAILFNRSRRD